MAPTCELLQCENAAVNLMDHTTCLHHLPCVSNTWHYSPSRCSHCIAFINKHFVGASSLESLSTPRNELERMVRRIRKLAKADNYSFVSFSPLASMLRSKSTSIEKFLEMPPVTLTCDSTPSVPSVRSSSKSGSASASHKSSRRSVGSSKLDLIMSKFDTIIANQQELKSGQESLNTRVGTLELEKVSSVSSRPGVPLEPEIIVSQLGSPSSFSAPISPIVSSVAPSTLVVSSAPVVSSVSSVSSSILYTSAGVAVSQPPLFSVPSSPLLAVPSSLSQGSFPSSFISPHLPSPSSFVSPSVHPSGLASSVPVSPSVGFPPSGPLFKLPYHRD